MRPSKEIEELGLAEDANLCGGFLVKEKEEEEEKEQEEKEGGGEGGGRGA